LCADYFNVVIEIIFKIYTIHFQQVDPTEDRSSIIPSASVFEPPRDHVDDPKPVTGGFWLFLWMLLIVLALCAIGVGGLAYYQKRQEQSRKRFY